MPAKQFTVFISYSHSDGEALVGVLRQKIDADTRGKEITFWQDYSQMKYGQWSKQIEDAIDAVEFLVMLITPGALASTNCKDEWMYARKKGVPVLPVNGKPDDADFYKSFPNWLKKQHIYHPEKNWERLINDLNTKPQTLKIPFMAPRLSALSNYVKRVEKLKHLKNLLLHADEPVAITTALQGSGGFGKTTLAVALCNDDEIINAFVDGILWVTLGQQKATALNAMQKLYDAMSNDNKNFVDVEQAQQYLSEVLTGKNCLLVLDDVWHRTDAENILKTADKCTVLITTRMDKLLLNAKQEHVDEMTRDEAIEHLSSYTGGGNLTYDEPLGKLADKLGYWALLLRLAGGQLKARTDEGESIEEAIGYVNKKLERKGLFGFDRSDAEQRNDSVQICLAASIDLLIESEKEKLYSLGIFPEDENIPFVIVEKYWNMDYFDCEELLERFHRYGLIDLDVPGKTVRMHDILLKYYGTCLHDKRSQHLSLIEKFGSFKTWRDKYIWVWCIWHLAEALAYEDAIKLLADNYWIEGKLTATGNLYEVIADYQLLPASDEILLIQKALLLSAAVIADDPVQLPQQLYGRLGLIENGLCRQLAEQALKAICSKEISLKPLHPNFEMPDIHGLAFRGHTGHIRGALIQNDFLVSWSDDKTLRLWDIKTGKLKQIFSEPSSSIAGAILEKDILISWSDDKTLRLWDITSGKTKQVFTGNFLMVDGAWIKDSKLILWSDHTLNAWDILSGKPINIFEEYTSWVLGAMIYGDTLVCWFRDGTLKSLDTLSGKTVHIFEGHTSQVKGASIQDNTLISWSYDNTIRLWDIHSGKTIQVFQSYINGALIKGNILISWYNDGLQAWDIVSGKIIHIFEGHSSEVKGALLQNDLLISWSYDHTLRLWDIVSGKLIHIFEGHSLPVKGALIQDETLLSWSDDYTLRVWNIHSGETKQILKHHSIYIRFISNYLHINRINQLRQGNRLVSWTDNNILYLWDMGFGKRIQTSEDDFSWVVGALIQDETAVSWHVDGTLRSWDIVSGTDKHVFKGHSSGIDGALAKDNTLISWSGDKTLRLWDIHSGKAVHVFEGHLSSVKGALIKGDSLISWTDKTIRSRNINFKKDDYIIETYYSSSINSVLVNNDLLISWYDKMLQAYDIYSGKAIHSFEGHSSSINGALIKDDILISWSKDRTLRIWDVLSGENKQILKKGSSQIIGALIQDDTIISWSGERVFRSWDIYSGESKQVFKGHLFSIKAASIHSDMLISISENELLIWNLSTAVMIKRLEGKGFIQFQVHENFLYLVDKLNSISVYHFPSLEYVCRLTIDASINVLKVACNLNRIILGDASGRMHFLGPIGFHV